MSKETEKVFKEMNKYLEMQSQENMSMEDMNDMMQKFIEEYNSNLSGEELSEKTAKTSDDYLLLAENAETMQLAIKYAEKSLQLDEDNIDAKVMLAEFSTEHTYEMVYKFKELIVYAEKVMKKKGYMNEESIGSYWGIVETRPFIRLYSNYLDLLLNCGMILEAKKVAQEIIKYNESDNLGARYILMHIYAYLEDEKSILELHNKYDEHEETQMLLPISILYFKLQNFDKAEKYLRRLEKVNKDINKFVKAYLEDSLDEYINEMNTLGYRPFSIEELIVELNENIYLFGGTIPFYFDWAEQVLKKKKRKS